MDLKRWRYERNRSSKIQNLVFPTNIFGGDVSHEIYPSLFVLLCFVEGPTGPQRQKRSQCDPSPLHPFLQSLRVFSVCLFFWFWFWSFPTLDFLPLCDCYGPTSKGALLRKVYPWSVISEKSIGWVGRTV